jgi:DNA (cytosine-5)-methyltransferase 1
MRPSEYLRVGSLFTGGGGLDMAVHSLWPARVAWCSEVDPHASRLLEARMGVPNLGDITAIDWHDVEPVDVLVGGFPCQDISHAGKRAGITEETRSGLWFHFAHAVRVLRPRLVLAENVAAITTLAGAHDAVLGELADLGFDAEWGVLRASDVGAPHQRARWFLAAWPADSDGPRLEGRPEGPGGAGAEDTPAGRSGGGAAAPSGRLAMLPTPRSAADRASRASLTRDGHWSAPSLAQAVELAQGILPREYESWDEVQGWHGKALPTPTVADSRGARNATSGRSNPDSAHHLGTTLNDVAHADRWGEYGPAVAHWEALLGRPAPDPTDDRGRLSPAFVEWMMGWPAGWVDLDGLSRANRLKILGNGVVPQQAAAAFGQLLARAAAQEVAA